MNSAIERLLSLRVADVMSKQVLCLSRNDTMGHAAQLLLNHSVSGIPVVDEQEFCIGILSAMDFVKKHNGTCADSDGITRSLVQEGPERPWRIDAVCNDRVSQHLSPAVQTIAADKPLLAAARMMCAEHIHRLPVLDLRGRPIGMLTSLDVVSALVSAIEE